jgi:acetyl esterase
MAREDLYPAVRDVLGEMDQLPDVDELTPEAARRQMVDQLPDHPPTPVEAVTDRTIPGPDSGSGPGPDPGSKSESECGSGSTFESESDPDREIPIRVYEPGTGDPRPAFVYFHGGGWVVGNLETHDELCRVLCRETGAVVVSVDYRLAPEHPFPAPIEDCYAALSWVAGGHGGLGTDGRLVVGGDSAGGNLAAVAALLARDRGAPAVDHQVLIYPATAADFSRGSYRENGEGYGLTRAEMRWFRDRYLGTPYDVHDRNPYAWPEEAADLSGVAPATVVTAEYDPLRDDGTRYAERLTAAGVDARLENYDGVIHGFVGMLQEPDLPAAREAIDLIAARIEESL